MNRQITFSEKEYLVLADKIDEVTRVFETATERHANTTLSMGSGIIVQTMSNDEPCKTIACVAGCYLLGKIQKPIFKAYTCGSNILTNDKGKSLTYQDGANTLAKDLDFNNKSHLQAWADDNPAIWGNKYGIHMFTSGMAYINVQAEKTTIKDVIDHFRSVSVRMRNPNKRIKRNEL